MIIVKTPLRIGFVGGGSDQSYFYKEHAGAVVSATIDKYIYIAVNKKFDNKVRASYSTTEIVDHSKDLQHNLIRESMHLVGCHNGIEIVSISDIPANGSGLGSSSSYTVGVLNGLYAHVGITVSPERLAEEARYVEGIGTTSLIGKQDQYAAAYGGLNYIQFNPDGKVVVEPLTCPQKTRIALSSKLLLLYTGIERDASKILSQQKNEYDKDARDALREMTALAVEMKEALNRYRLETFGELLDENWQLKKSLYSGVSNDIINDYYTVAKDAGAIGGKLCGAGGGGFLLLYAPKEKHNAIIDAVNLKPVDFSFSYQGSEVVYKE